MRARDSSCCSCVIQESNFCGAVLREAGSSYPALERPAALHGVAGQSLLIGVSEHVRYLRDLCPALAMWLRPIVIEGATGTGKGLVMEEIRRHLAPGTPFQRLTAAAEPELLQSFLYGYRKHSFTGADEDRPGLVELLESGILGLDEFQDVSDRLQGVLVDLTDRKPVWPVGAKRAIVPNLRFMIGTQIPLRDLWRLGRLREDLYARLEGVPVKLLPLAERREDIPLLVAHLLERIELEVSSAPATVSGEALELLTRYSWPRNIRELEHVLAIAVFHAVREQQAVIRPHHLPTHLHDRPVNRPSRGGRPRSIADDQVERAVRRMGSVEGAAALLGVSTRTVLRSLKRLRAVPPLDHPSEPDLA